jgi:hypothetical protein
MLDGASVTVIMNRVPKQLRKLHSAFSYMAIIISRWASVLTIILSNSHSIIFNISSILWWCNRQDPVMSIL